MDLEQTVKDLQSQNAQFQQLLMTLAKGQEDLKVLLEKEKVKKKKRIVGVATLGRRFKGPLNQPVDLTSSSKEGENQEGETREEDPRP